MRVISHRGYWKTAEEKNTTAAFMRSFTRGIGTETDLRDHNGQVVISHDPSDERAMTLPEYLALVQSCGAPNLLQALNIKADGLAKHVAKALNGFAHPWFVFDMSVPDMVQHLKVGNPVYARMSEYEPFPAALRDSIQGIWLDGFNSTWFTKGDIEALLDQGLGVCVVSPELHGRLDAKELWSTLQPLRDRESLTLCTDLPSEAAAAIGVPLD